MQNMVRNGVASRSGRLLALTTLHWFTGPTIRHGPNKLVFSSNNALQGEMNTAPTLPLS